MPSRKPPPRCGNRLRNSSQSDPALPLNLPPSGSSGGWDTRQKTYRKRLNTSENVPHVGPDGLHLAASITADGVITPDSGSTEVQDEHQTETAGVNQAVGDNADYTDRQEVSDDPRPKIVLPGKDRLLSDVAAEIGHVLAGENIYRHAGQAAVYDEKSKTLVEAKAAPFRSWVERFVIPIRREKKGEAPHSMSSGDAGAILASGHFLDCLRDVERVNPVCLPITRAAAA